MTQSPRGGQAAPLDTTAGPAAPAAETWSAPGTGSSTPADERSAGGVGGAVTAPPFVSADSRTGTMPAVTDARTSTPAAGAPARADATAPNAANRSAARARGPRRARLQLRHVNPWTVLKFSCVLAIALFFVWLIVVGVLFGVLDAAGVIGKVNHAYTTLKGGGAQSPITASIVFGVAALIGVINIILFIALSTIGSVIYNLCADLVGGIEVTLSER